MSENEINLDYFYGMQAEMFSFLRIPKILIKDGRFEKMSNEAKMLFGLLLDRMSLSMKNKWFDDDNRVYIIYTTDEIMIDLCIGTQKCVKLLKELETFGLIERRKQGFSKPDIIYVKNFSILANDGMEIPKESEAKVKSRREKKSKPEVVLVDEGEMSTNVDNSTVFRKSKHESFENQNTRVSEIKTREFRKSKHESFEIQNARASKIETREFPKSKPNNTNINNTNYSNTDFNNTDWDVCNDSFIPSLKDKQDKTNYHEEERA
ncbi:MAG: replication initiator protein A, partial [Lachnospiraceae bacterium]|nr:replication initiator protein A [Lachnospiraceae bacterium]